MEARYAHWRPNGAWRREDQFSDGTLRLIALPWALLDGDSLVLLEAPELSLNDAIVHRIPVMIDQIKRQAKYRHQRLITTHSEAILSNPVDGRAVLLVLRTEDAAEIRGPTEEEIVMLENGLSPADVLLPKPRPQLDYNFALFCCENRIMAFGGQQRFRRIRRNCRKLDLQKSRRHPAAQSRIAALGTAVTKSCTEARSTTCPRCGFVCRSRIQRASKSICQVEVGSQACGDVLTQPRTYCRKTRGMELYEDLT